MKPAILGIAGPALAAEEAALFRAHPPSGVVLFARNIENPRQLVRLTADLRSVLPQGAVLMVDQEGGRVARLRPPHWRAHPAAAMLGALHARKPEAGLRAAWLTGALIGLDCAAAGFNVVCAPVLDLRCIGAHDVVGDRAFCGDPERIAPLAGAWAAGLLAAGVQPVAKHAPGHGRARSDSHAVLPLVDAPEEVLAADLEPFRALHHLPWMMSAHVCYHAWDAERPATLSPVVIEDVIRGRIGFSNLLVTDDLAMGALKGPAGQRAVTAVAAGCDLALHCSGDAKDNYDVLTNSPWITEAAAVRLHEVEAAAAAARITLDAGSLAAERDGLLA
jgi:beta-N-acetylhexosaminidase